MITLPFKSLEEQLTSLGNLVSIKFVAAVPNVDSHSILDVVTSIPRLLVRNDFVMASSVAAP